MGQWLTDHPGKAEADFQREAWPHLRANLLEARQARRDEAARAEARRRIAGELAR
jgi:hypothetical protein